MARHIFPATLLVLFMCHQALAVTTWSAVSTNGGNTVGTYGTVSRRGDSHGRYFLLNEGMRFAFAGTRRVKAYVKSNALYRICLRLYSGILKSLYSSEADGAFAEYTQTPPSNLFDRYGSYGRSGYSPYGGGGYRQFGGSYGRYGPPPPHWRRECYSSLADNISRQIRQFFLATKFRISFEEGDEEDEIELNY
uniref:Uncharacterized protein n=1 Tax=Caenorhabditis japonica TaxID=281687 RepID=A0A8R1HYM1_CAEJA